MALMQVQKNGTIMQIDAGNLSIWTSAGWTPVQQSSSSSTPTSSQTQPTTQSQPSQTYTPPQPTSSAPTSGGNVNLAAYGITNPNQSLTSDQMARLQADYDNLQPVNVVDGGVYKTIGYTGYLIPKATVVGPNGDRVVVRTDNLTGKYRTANEMTSQGYKIEGNTPGQSADKTITSNGVMDQGQRPALKLRDGTIVQPTDPNYDKYSTVQGVTKIANTDKQILSDNGRLYAWDGKTATYIPDQGSLQNYVNQGYADTRASYSGVAQASPSSSSSGFSQSGAPSGSYNAGSQPGSATNLSGGNTAIPAAVNPQDAQWVNSLYQKYFDRVATSSELANWAKESPQALEQFLQADAKKYGYTSKYFQQQNGQNLDQALSIINNSNLPPAIKDLWSTVVKGYPPGIEFNTQEILKTFQNIKDNTIDPHFRELANIAMNDVKNQVDTLKQNRSTELETEQTNAKQNVKDAQQNLESSGLTFSGKAVDQLGDKSAFQQPGANGKSALPDQTALPFGGLAEGKVNQANRLMATSSANRYTQAMKSIGSSAEQQLGSGGISGLGLDGYSPIGGVTGNLETQKEGQYSTTLNQIIDNYNKKQALNTNVQTS